MRRVVIDPGTRNCRNMGDLAMLQVAVARVGAVLPGATIHVFTEDPDELARQCPGVRPLPHWGREAWVDDRQLWGPLRRVLRGPIWRIATGTQREIRQRWPGLYRRALAWRFAARPGTSNDVDAFLECFHRAELVVFCGQGTLADAAYDQARLMLETAAIALRAGIPVYFFGQGIGPMTHAGLRRHAGAVLAQAKVVALREERKGRSLTQSLGVPGDRIVMTGDDAVELAYAARPEQLGNGLGVHLRVAPLAVRDTDVLQRIRPVLQGFARERGIPMIPLPISHHRFGANDPRTIRQLLAGFDDASDGGAETDTPQSVIRAAGRCRLVVTGAYHAAVFALAQGVPVICLARSSYYLDKFLGLRDQFGDGCEILDLADPELETRLRATMEPAWEMAGRRRELLLRIAEQQVFAGREAYRRLNGTG